MKKQGPEPPNGSTGGDDPGAMNARPPRNAEPNAPPVERGDGSWLLVARITWVSALAIGLFAIGLPPYFAELATVCTRAAGACAESGLLTPEAVRELEDLGLSAGFYAAYNVALDLVFAAVWCGTGAIIFLRRSDDGMALLASLALVTFGSFQESQEIVAKTYPPLELPSTLVALVGFTSVILFVYLLPDGRFVPRWMLIPALAWILNDAVSVLFSDGIEPAWLDAVGFFAFFVPAFLAVGSQVYRYRRTSDVTQRQQTKWVVFGIVAGFGGYLVLVAVQGIYFGFREDGLLPFVFFESAPNVVFLAIPLSVGLAVMRSRLWNIDVLINRALVYGTLTGYLALVYFGSVVLLGGALRALSGGPLEQQSQLVVVASTLAIAVLFVPLRRRVQAFIDRRFYRRKYDAAKTLDKFGARLRRQTDLDALRGDLMMVARETMQPAPVSLWLKTVIRNKGEHRT